MRERGSSGSPPYRRRGGPDRPGAFSVPADTLTVGTRSTRLPGDVSLRIGGRVTELGFAAVLGRIGSSPLHASTDLDRVPLILEMIPNIALASLSSRYAPANIHLAMEVVPATHVCRTTLVLRFRSSSLVLGRAPISPDFLTPSTHSFLDTILLPIAEATSPTSASGPSDVPRWRPSDNGAASHRSTPSRC